MANVIEKLEQLTDPRRSWGNLRHKLVDIVFIGLVSIVCGGTDFEHMEDIGHEKFDWFKKRLELPNGVPDSDTFRRVFERLNPKELSDVLQDLVSVAGKNVAIDGKTIRGSKNTSHRAYHIVSAWVAENQITLGQLVTEEKSNEITAIPELLNMLDVEDTVVSIDAMGCHKEIAEVICANNADYVLSLKANQKTIFEDIKLYFSTEQVSSLNTPPEKNHGRIERRTYFLETDIDWLYSRRDWRGLRGIGMVKSSITILSTGENREENRYFITSLTDIKKFADAVRKHWSIENQLHWQLDVSLREDSGRARKNNSPLNLNIMRKEALSLLNRTYFGKRFSVRRKMACAAMNSDKLDLILDNKK